MAKIKGRKSDDSCCVETDEDEGPELTEEEDFGDEPDDTLATAKGARGGVSKPTKKNFGGVAAMAFMAKSRRPMAD